MLSLLPVPRLRAALEPELAALCPLDVQPALRVRRELRPDGLLWRLALQARRELALADLGVDLARGHRLALAAQHLDRRPHRRALARGARGRLGGRRLLLHRGLAHRAPSEWVAVTAGRSSW